MAICKLWPAWAWTLAALAGCTVGPNYRAPQAVAPPAFDAPATRPAVPLVDPTRWWRSLHDPALDALVERAVRDNLDLQMALARLQQARAMEYLIAGGALPYLEAAGAAGRGSGNNSTKGRITAPLNAAANTTGLHEITEVLGFDAGWELDLFGRYRRQIEAAAADTQAAAEARNDVLITLIADVARAYVELRALQIRLELTRQDSAAQQQTLDVVQQRFDRGLTNELDVTLARRQLATVQASMPALEAAIAQAQRRLAVLLGLSPEALHNELAQVSTLPDLPEQVAIGLPVEMLRRRPDIRRAERQLAAETARIGVATADLFPRVAVTAGLGLQGQGLGHNPVTSSLIWSAGPAVIWPVLDFGRIDSLIAVEDYRTRELLDSYRQAALRAIEETDNALNNYVAGHQQLARLAEALDASRRAVTLANGRYDRGLIDFLNVLDAQRQLYVLQEQYTVAQQSVVVQYVALYKALGGGWENYQAVPPIREPRPAVLAAGVQLLHPDPQIPPAPPRPAASQP